MKAGEVFWFKSLSFFVLFKRQQPVWAGRAAVGPTLPVGQPHGYSKHALHVREHSRAPATPPQKKASSVKMVASARSATVHARGPSAIISLVVSEYEIWTRMASATALRQALEDWFDVQVWNSEVMTSSSWWMRDMKQELHWPLRIPWTKFFLADLVWWTYSWRHSFNLQVCCPIKGVLSWHSFSWLDLGAGDR